MSEPVPDPEEQLKNLLGDTAAGQMGLFDEATFVELFSGLRQQLMNDGWTRDQAQALLAGTWAGFVRRDEETE